MTIPAVPSGVPEIGSFTVDRRSATTACHPESLVRGVVSVARVAAAARMVAKARRFLAAVGADLLVVISEADYERDRDVIDAVLAVDVR